MVVSIRSLVTKNKGSFFSLKNIFSITQDTTNPLSGTFSTPLFARINFWKSERIKAFYFQKNLFNIGKSLLFLSIYNNTVNFYTMLNKIELNAFLIQNRSSATLYQYLEAFSIESLIKDLQKYLKRTIRLKIDNRFMGLDCYIYWYKSLLIFLLSELIDLYNAKHDLAVLISFENKSNRLIIAVLFPEGRFNNKNSLVELIHLAKILGVSTNVSFQKRLVQFSIELTLLYNRKLVQEKDGEFIPLFKAQGVSRDNFFHLRRQLIALGCNNEDVIPVAREISKKVLKVKTDFEYHQYIFHQTYTQCYQRILNNYKFFPIQDPEHPLYSHIDLFSSIYGFEIDYLRHINFCGNVADIGCGDGLFLRLLKDFMDITGEGYEITIPEIKHDVKITRINEFCDIHTFYDCIFLNHVLEHVEESPAVFLKQLIQHFNRLGPMTVTAVIISIPVHLSIDAHRAAKHRWLFYEHGFEHVPEQTPEYGLQQSSQLEIAGNLSGHQDYEIKSCHFSRELTPVLKELGYKLYFNTNIGIYIVQRVA